MEPVGSGWIGSEQEEEQGLLICGIYCNICDLKRICLSKEMFNRAAF